MALDVPAQSHGLNLSNGQFYTSLLPAEASSPEIADSPRAYFS